MAALSPEERVAGVLLHPTSLPGPYGIGDIGAGAHAWVDLLADSGTALWQTLPLGPTGYADSPYQCFSSFAGNTNLISPDALVDDGLLDAAELAGVDFPLQAVDYGPVIAWKHELLASAHARFVSNGATHLRAGLADFRAEQRWWVEDFALFMAIKEAHGGVQWTKWPRSIRLRDPDAIRAARRRHADAVERWIFIQYVFERQWSALHGHAGERRVRIIGDLPLYVAGDSADVWSRPELFRLDDEGNAVVVAGVPPDYFSPTGQLWGNPIYDWPRHGADDFEWWSRRLGRTLELVDIVRLDHFRGLADYWEIPAGSATAETGRWLAGPGMGFFDAIRRKLGESPIIAEDLGAPSPASRDLLAASELPGMRILQFAFDTDDTNDFLPHRYPEATVAYTGTHDNDTTLGWWETAPAEELAFARRYLEMEDADPVSAFLDSLWGSKAMAVVAPLQDLLGLGSEARMNVPGTTDGNWRWRALPDEISEGIRDRLATLNRDHDRWLPDQPR
jgi:4-alpha-glucanotransferase